MTYDHGLHVAQEQYDSREPRAGGDELCDNCGWRSESHEYIYDRDGVKIDVADGVCPDEFSYIVATIREHLFTPLTEESERELRAAMRGDL